MTTSDHSLHSPRTCFSMLSVTLHAMAALTVAVLTTAARTLAKVDEAYLDICAAGARDAASRHAVFSFVAGTWRRDYRSLLAEITLPTLVLSGRDVGAAGAGGGKAAPTEVDKTSYKGLFSWFKVIRPKGDARRSGPYLLQGPSLVVRSATQGRRRRTLRPGRAGSGHGPCTQAGRLRRGADRSLRRRQG